MDPIRDRIRQSRRDFLTSTASGIGLVALASMLRKEGLLAAEASSVTNPLAPRRPHFEPKAKACICIYLEGAPSQIDLFDPKPTLNKLHGQKLPESFTKNVRFAFIQKETARLLGSPRRFTPRGQCGMELSDYLPFIGEHADDIALIRSMHTEQFNHHPGQLMMNCGSPMFGRPSLGAWLTYGLGSESQNLPGYVVLNAGRGTSGGASNWSSGFLPTHYQGVLFRNQGDPVLDLSNPPGLTESMQRQTIEALRALNTQRQEQVRDPEINSRIAAYELAFRMQAAAPELIDLSGESPETLAMYGVDREDPPEGGRGGVGAGGGTGVFRQFAINCLLARRLVERGVRFVNLYHASWDHHNNLDVELGFNCRMADQPIAALLTDLKRRGLLDTTLVLWASEFGRTPLGENRPGFKEVNGRDHHPFAFSLWMAGGGIKGGQVIGKTDEIGWNIVEDPIHIHDYHATILHLFGFDHTRLTYRFQGRDFRLTDVGGKVITRLLA
ncbi:MAG: DUF1501 domain-containing protein [Isosphaeraceae bacterium]|nr:DUF1501 domain-containing protein [Isosphaeraceae bacterium]